MKTMTNKEGDVTCPYTAQNVDAAIAHLERALSSEGAHSLFGQTYWRARVMQANATLGLMHSQRVRLQRLLDLLANAGETSVHRSNHPGKAPDGRMHV